jgi:hypothetical protein
MMPVTGRSTPTMMTPMVSVNASRIIGRTSAGRSSQVTDVRNSPMSEVSEPIVCALDLDVHQCSLDAVDTGSLGEANPAIQSHEWMVRLSPGTTLRSWRRSSLDRLEQTRR